MASCQVMSNLMHLTAVGIHRLCGGMKATMTQHNDLQHEVVVHWHSTGIQSTVNARQGWHTEVLANVRRVRGAAPE